MKVINGRYNSVKIMIDEVEDTALEQIQFIADHPAMENSNIVIMPDCHAGAGCVIGFTQDISGNDYVIPNLIGVDIGCGVFSMNLGNIDIDFEKLDEFIKRNIPYGFNHRKKTHPFTNDIFPFKNPVESHDTIMRQVGTLGGGNHFIEIGVDSNNDKRLFVHCGSRNFGKKIAEHYQHKAKEYCAENSISVPKGTEFMHKSNKFYQQYMKDLEYAQYIAYMNRKLISLLIAKELTGTDKLKHFDTVHNYIEQNIVRKGAISAYDNQLCAIPFNMRDGVAICRGKGNKEWNFSAPHGAGRTMSRKKARKAINAQNVKREMANNNIFTTTAHLAVDEAPQAYKEKEIILNAIAETVDIIDFVKPIYNFKAY